LQLVTGLLRFARNDEVSHLIANGLTFVITLKKRHDKQMPTLSVIIIAKNEAHQIVRCLRSVHGWADEIIVLDSGSSDRTVDICRQYTPHVTVTDWPGYGRQKQRALDQANGQWVLSIDADEWVRANLREEIKSAIHNGTYSGFYIPRLTMFCGRFQRYGDASKDKVLRLFRRECGHFTDDFVHERMICSGRIGTLKHPLLHNAYRTEAAWAAQIHRYAIQTAELRHTKGKHTHPIKAYLSCFWAFFRSYILRSGYRDGHVGYLYAKLNAKSSYQRQMHLWQLRKRGSGLTS